MTEPLSATELRRFDDLPGPRALPLLGNLHQIRVDRAHLVLESWGRIYGPLFRFKVGPMSAIGVTHHAAIAELLKDRPDGYRRTPRTLAIATEMGLIPGVFGSEGQSWRNQRRMVMASFAPGHVRSYFPHLLKVTQRLRKRWVDATRRGDAIDLQADLMRYTVDGVAGLAFGTEVNTLESPDEVIQQHLDKIFPALFRRSFSRVPYWRLLRLKADRELDASVAAIRLAIDGFIAQARARLQADPSLREQPASLLEAMIVAADEGDSGVTDQQVAGNVFTMLLAGEDTTANTLAWMTYLLHENPDVLQRAADEVQRHAPDPTAYTPEQIASLDYLEACAMEAMRLKPVAPLIVLEALRDTQLADVRVPAGTSVWCVMRHDSLQDTHFADPAAFRPERWLSADAAASHTSPRRVAMPFGAGPRVCPGRYLALLEIKLAMAMLLGSFHIDHLDTPDGGPPQELLAFTMSPVGLRMTLRERLAPA